MRRWLLPLSWLYGLGVSVRNRRYDEGRGIVRLPVPVVSVGNISVGGTGKTPFVAALARELMRRGESVGILSRGYRRRDRSPFLLVSDGRSLLATPQESGDEPFELATALPSVAVAVGPDRAFVGERLIQELGPRVLVLDDGFQHRRLYRDLDLVCVDTSESDAAMALVPAGRLREPLSSLERAHALIARGGHPDFVPPGVPVVRTSAAITGFDRVGADERLSAESFRSQPVGLVVAVARPERVRASVPADVVFFHSRRDHHWWREDELDSLARAARAQGASALLTTGKDAVKLRSMVRLDRLPLPLYRIRFECRVETPDVLERLLSGVRLSPG